MSTARRRLGCVAAVSELGSLLRMLPATRPPVDLPSAVCAVGIHPCSGADDVEDVVAVRLAVAELSLATSRRQVEFFLL